MELEYAKWVPFCMGSRGSGHFFARPPHGGRGVIYFFKGGVPDRDGGWGWLILLRGDEEPLPPFALRPAPAPTGIFIIPVSHHSPMDMPRSRTAILFIACIALPLIVGVAGSVFTVGSIAGWYVGLNKPVFTPPAWVFAPAWTVLYILMGCALFFVVKEGTGTSLARQGLILFFAQLALNFGWSLVFFGTHAVAAALVVLLLLIVLIAATTLVFRRISVPAAWLLVPYLVWCCFAASLNAGILLLN